MRATIGELGRSTEPAANACTPGHVGNRQEQDRPAGHSSNSRPSPSLSPPHEPTTRRPAPAATSDPGRSEVRWSTPRDWADRSTGTFSIWSMLVGLARPFWNRCLRRCPVGRSEDSELIATLARNWVSQGKRSHAARRCRPRGNAIS